jgi:mediator of RNA polymerase II transcription subunit 16
LSTTLSKLLDRLDPAKIMFFDTRWLGLDNSMRTAALLKTHKVDVCQKIVLKPRARGDGEDGEDGSEMKLRRCTRCFEYMEDFSPGQGQGHMNWLTGSAKHCVCSNAWMIAEEKL